jgi:deoxyribodipyrimidine photolyase-related protein
MPGYDQLNFFNHTRPLPDFYWGAPTDMNCVAQCVASTRAHAYAHHIQRLMVTGNFALLAGLIPEEVCAWYLAVYVDAFEWVELPNTLGMALHADGGIMASKPYISSGQYIDRMSDYCQGCRYSVKEAHGDKACPFNYLYWNFLITHQDKLAKNPRLAMPYKNLARMSEDKKTRYVQDAARFLASLKPAYAR